MISRPTIMVHKLLGAVGAFTMVYGSSSTASALQGGSNDTTHTFAVGVARDLGGIDEVICTGILLGPNLVATARHCVASVSSATIDCSVTLGSVTAERLSVTTDATITPAGKNVTVSNVVVPEPSACAETTSRSSSSRKTSLFPGTSFRSSLP
jgi:hypothetical protein